MFNFCCHLSQELLTREGVFDLCLCGFITGFILLWCYIDNESNEKPVDADKHYKHLTKSFLPKELLFGISNGSISAFASSTALKKVSPNKQRKNHALQSH